MTFTEREEDDSEDGRTPTKRNKAQLMETRTRFLPNGDLLVMGALHHDHAAYCGSLHKLHATAEEGRSHTRDGHIDICW
jgi:hypothetical protein